MRIPNILPMLLLAFSMSVAAQTGPCEIYNLVVETGPCNNDGTYAVKLNFQVENPTSDKFDLVGNGQVLGTYSLNDLPLTINHFPNVGSTGYVKVCIDDNPNCCRIKQFVAPNCNTTGPCEIYDLTVDNGPCNSDGTYTVKVNFKVSNATNDLFNLVGNGQVIGTYKLSELPLTVKLPNVGPTGYIKVCINDNPNCCRIKEFAAPDCNTLDPCKITDVKLVTGDCMPGGQYKLTLNFKATNPGSDFFELWTGAGVSLGKFPLSQLPLSLPFPWGGGPVDKIKICIAGNPDCCTVAEIQAPPCFNPCRIENLRVETGKCTSDSTYEVWVKFQQAATSPVDSFDVWAGNGAYLGRFATANMPIYFEKFPWGGGSVDAIKVCVSNSCCRTKSFNVPECLAPPCGINDLSVKVGGCTTPKSYKLQLNFILAAPTPAPVKFNVYADNGDLLGTYSTADLPVGINFPWNGDKTDALKVCLLNADGKEYCCKVIQFDAPDCVGVTCGIFNLEVKTGQCTGAGTYEVWINFQTPAASLSKFGVWTGTGKFLGFFTPADLPIYIKNFPASGKSTDKVLICFGSACCETKEFNAPDCAGQPCDIVDLKVDVGDCTSDSTYKIAINFHLSNPTPGTNLPFVVYSASGKALGTFTIADLPVTILNFPWNGNSVDAVKICVGSPNSNAFCCKVQEFKAPACLGDPCGIFDLKVETGPCNDNGTYQIWVNFKTTSLAGGFSVWAGNGAFLGTFSVSALPIHIKNFPGSGNAVDAVKVCLLTTTAGTPVCCRTKEFKAPDCTGNPCGLADLTVKTGVCTSDKTYEVWINFKLNNPTNTTKFAVYANGTLYGEFPLSALPLYIKDFPYNGGSNDVVKVCIISPLTVLCCETVEFKVPDCLQTGPCEIYDLKVDPGACTSDKTYSLYLDFKVHNPSGATHFTLWANGTQLGTYALSALPLTIQQFPWGGGQVDVVKVCLATANVPPGSSTCCRTLEFKAPDCILKHCDIVDLKVETGPCNDDGTYQAWVKFSVNNPPALSTHFGVWANGKFLGFFPLTQLPLSVPHFPTDGGPNDVIKVCLSNSGAIACCETLEFPVPDCVPGSACKIYDVQVGVGDCHNDGTYQIKVDFKVDHPGNDFFELWAGNGKYLGYFKLADLPMILNNFPASGHSVDVLKICINDNPNCCKTVEFKAPDCAVTGCEITNLKVETGDCNADGTYHAWVNFQAVTTTANAKFGLWANGNFIGNFALTDLPVHIEHFPTDGGPNDVVKVCILNPDPASSPLCCKTLEFKVPDCASHPCEIVDLTVKTGDCNDDGTYHAWIDFKVSNTTPTGLFFAVWANGKFLGSFPLTNLPYHIEHFPTDGGPNDVVKVCLVTPNATQPLCCKSKEFAVPDCPSVDCKIYDLQVLTTACLCGQFFAVVTFEHKNGGSAGFDIVGNGVNYGTFGYDKVQPILLGPLNGDGLTKYEFVVRDHNHPDCHDAVDVGIVDCTPQVQASGSPAGKLALSPNPTANWLTVTAQLTDGIANGQATVEIRHADGRLARTVVVPNAGAFQLDVSELPAGLYRLSVQTAGARLDSTFAKQ